MTELAFSTELIVTTSEAYAAAVVTVRSYFAATEGFLLESVSFTSTDLVTTQVTIVMSVTSTSTIETVITEVITDITRREK